MALTEFKKITLDDMFNELNNKSAEEKAAFKKAAFNSKGSYSHLNAVRYFCSKYHPELLPVAKPKAPNKSDIISKW